MTKTFMTRGRWFLIFGTMGLAGMFAMAAFASSPPFIYPSTPSVPVGVYGRIFSEPAIGQMASFPIPAAARAYQQALGHTVSENFRIMKPIIAGPGDHVCNSVENGLFVNGVLRGKTFAYDSHGNDLPHWSGCRSLGQNQFFMMSDYVPNSFDSRYFGPIERAEIAGVYRPLF